jgi:hypothetical protein
MATLHSLPVAREAAPDLLTPARHRLRQTIAAVDRVSRETEAAAEQVHRLTDVVAAHDRLQAKLGELYDRDQAATGQWIAGGRIGLDPLPRRHHQRLRGTRRGGRWRSLTMS